MNKQEPIDALLGIAQATAKLAGSLYQDLGNAGDVIRSRDEELRSLMGQVLEAQSAGEAHRQEAEKLRDQLDGDGDREVMRQLLAAESRLNHSEAATLTAETEVIRLNDACELLRTALDAAHQDAQAVREQRERLRTLAVQALRDLHEAVRPMGRMHANDRWIEEWDRRLAAVEGVGRNP